MPPWQTTHGFVVFLAQSGAAQPASRAFQAWVLLGVLTLVVVALAGLAILTLVRRLALRNLERSRLDAAKPKRIPRSAWVEAGRRATPIPADAEGNDDARGREPPTRDEGTR